MKKKIIYFLPFLLLLSGLGLVGFSGKTAQESPPKKPNVLFIVVDDMNMWSLLNNYPVLKTPAIQKLRSQSYFFKNATCSAPKCVPSRAAFFSGKYPHNTGVYQNGPNVWGNSKVLAEAEAMPELFKRNGYTTWGLGKTFHVPLPGKREQEMFDNKLNTGNYGPFSTGKGHWFDIKPWEGPETDFTDVVNADALTGFFGKQHQKPFFIYYGLYRPHSPYTAPKRFFDMYGGVVFPNPPGYLENDLNDVPPLGKKLTDGMKQITRKGFTLEQGMQEYLKAYCANTSFADWNLGRVLDALEKSPYASNTIVVFSSDHGFHNGTKNHWTKETLWEQATVTPLLIKLPNGKAFTCPQTVNLIDIYPTLVEYCNLTPPKQKLDGKSMVPLFKEPKMAWDRPGLTTTRENYSAVLTEQYRYIRYADGSDELYDHRSDPYEYKNIAAEAAMKPVIAALSKSIPVRFQKSVPVKNDEVAQEEEVQEPTKKKAVGKKGG